MSEWSTNPGSDEARSAGCKCPVLDNAHGKGRGGNGAEFGWYVTGGCPVHGTGDQHVCEAGDANPKYQGC